MYRDADDSSMSHSVVNRTPWVLKKETLMTLTRCVGWQNVSRDIQAAAGDQRLQQRRCNERATAGDRHEKNAAAQGDYAFPAKMTRGIITSQNRWGTHKA